MGFRFGTCYEYPVFDIERRKKLTLRERPLIFMDQTIINDCYMGLGHTEKAIEYINKLKEICKAYNGDFVFLWHNSHLVTERQKEMYITTLSST